MPPVGFKPTIPVCERAKTIHALDRTATVIGPDLSPCDFDLIPKKKEPCRGIRFRTFPEIP
jgi:hypothetical protein